MPIRVYTQGLPPLGPSGYVLKIIDGQAVWVAPSDVFPEVPTFNDLPSAISNPGEIYYVTDSSGVWLVNRKSRGFYRSNGSVWEYAGELIEAFSDANFEVYSNSDPTRRVGINATSVSPGSKRSLVMPDRDVYLGLDSQYTLLYETACEAAVALNDWVYIDSGMLKVGSSNAISTSNVLGLVVNKPTALTADVLLSGLSPSIFSGLVPGQEYFLSNSGTLTPAITIIPGNVVVLLGTAVSSTQLKVNPSIRLIRS